MQHSCQIIAEVGSVHDGSLGNAKKLVEIARDAGADIVKFQTHIAEAETLPHAPTPAYFSGERRYDYFQRTSFTALQWRDLKNHCDEQKIEFMSSPFSFQAVDLLEAVGMERYKIPSGEVTNVPLLDLIAQTRKPVYLSSGMSTWDELDRAVNAILRVHNHITVLQCTSEYPCPHEDVGLNIMLEMRDRYKLPVGLSDHTLTPYASLAAVSLGATVIERHLTFSRLMYGSDAPHSLEPSEFSHLVQGIRAIETMTASRVDKDATGARLAGMKRIFEKSVVALVDIPEGAAITRDLVGVKKPGTGMPASRLPEIMGRRVRRAILKNSMLSESDLVD